MTPGERERILDSFPGLRGAPWTVTSPATEQYNCVAWAAQETERWWWPADSYFWPSTAARQPTVSAFVDAFISLGYGLSSDPELRPGILKIAIFSNDLGPTHVARQLPSGACSRLGSSVDISHPLDGLAGAAYGQVVQILERSAD